MKTLLNQKWKLALPLVLVSWITLPLAHAATGAWAPAGSPNYFRYGDQTATLLNNGKVLVAGNSTVSIAELYDPTTGVWTSTGSTGINRRRHTATLLATGKVIVTGGFANNYGEYGYFDHTQAAELYDPVAGTWSSTGSMSMTRAYHTATLLANGKLLVVGGSSYARPYNVLNTAELYDPTTGTWTSTGSMSSGRYQQHTATLLPNGQVLVAGGYVDGIGDLSTAELYNPATGIWTPTGSMNRARTYHTATLLGNGKVLVAGGRNSSDTELYDPATGTWTYTGSMSVGRSNHTATLIANGLVLVVGGGTELYNPVSGTWTPTTSMNSARPYHTATLLADGKVLVVGSVSGAESYEYLVSLTLDAVMHGSVTGNTSPYVFGSTSTLSAASDPGYLFTGWTGDVSGVTNPLSLFMDVDKTVGATFAPDINDTDGDGLTNYQEIVEYRTDPTKQDTDGDGAKDAVDGRPLDPTETLDTDLDGIGDNADLDDDADGLSDADEINIHGTNPKRVDSDGDGLTDPTELQTHLTNPNIADTDNDGLSDGAEVNTHGTNPKVADTDEDGFLDGYEVFTGKSPLNILDKPALVAEARTAIEFTFPSALGKTYRIEDSPDLTMWGTVESGITGNGGQILRFYSTRNMPKRYFRVEEDSP